MAYMGCGKCGCRDVSYKATAWFSRQGEFIEKGGDRATAYYCEGCKDQTHLRVCGRSDDDGNSSDMPALRE